MYCVSPPVLYYFTLRKHLLCIRSAGTFWICLTNLPIALYYQRSGAVFTKRSSKLAYFWETPKDRWEEEHKQKVASSLSLHQLQLFLQPPEGAISSLGGRGSDRQWRVSDCQQVTWRSKGHLSNMNLHAQPRTPTSNPVLVIPSPYPFLCSNPALRGREWEAERETVRHKQRTKEKEEVIQLIEEVRWLSG